VCQFLNSAKVEPKINFEYEIGPRVRIKSQRGKLLTKIKEQWIDLESAGLNTKILVLDNVQDLCEAAQRERQLFIGKMQATVESFAAFQRQRDFEERTKK
jgi:hypothetical protein